ncbi:hypothetical protein Cs7R123_09780 [Catellatospora sp. TT07R-123]|uniref:hypothetical protein n=1 Tax=Catellatospora sp. TT07R-123 TaxID=2733863 RepID=UPI001B189F83|nr:hypothetical protein [Catellatospora sp. TT07R-123]GHJ43636.1 hypothetical protein Cs7R123_09780 [Catellatospora sp. TT07R-123]
MTTYQLSIDFDSDGLTTLQAADQFVTIVKTIPRSKSLSWITFSPMRSNTITWTESYSVYASTTQIQEGALIETMSTQAAAAGSTYELFGGQFGLAAASADPNTYSVINGDINCKVNGVRMVTSGLYQSATVNGTPHQGAINAVAVPYLDTATFIPKEVVQVFASSYHDNGLVISKVQSSALEVDLTTKTAQSLHYNAAINQFALV